MDAEKGVVEMIRRSEVTRWLALVSLVGMMVLSQTVGALAGPVTITLWGHVNSAWIEANKYLIGEFEKANPGIKVKYEVFPYDAYIQKLPVAFASGTEADVIEIFGTWVGQYPRQGVLEPVPASLLTLQKARELYFEAALGGFIHEGKLYGIPHEFNIEAGGVLVNTDMARKAGIEPGDFANWDAFIATAQKLTRFESGKMVVAGYHFVDYDPVTFLLYSFILQKGGSIWQRDGRHLNLTSPQAKEALQFLVDLARKYKVVDPWVYERKIGTGTVAAFFSGQAAMVTRGPWIVATGRQDYPSVAAQYVALPHFGSAPRFYAESGWGKAVSARSKHKEAAWKLVEFMAKRTENALKWNEITGTLPAFKELVRKGALLEKYPELAVPYKILDYGVWVGPVVNRDRMWMDINYKYVLQALRGEMTVEQALQAMEKENNAMVDEVR